MIDTKSIRKELEDSRLLIHAKVNYPNPLFDGHEKDVMKFILLLEKICDSHDELKEELSKYADYIDGEWHPNTMGDADD